MAHFVWEERFDIGVSTMNADHKYLLKLMEKLHQENERQVGDATLLKLLKDLQRFTIDHFAREEKYMASIQYPQLATHKIVHERLLTQLDSHIQGYAKSGGILPPQLFRFLRTWLSAHICGIDAKYGSHAKQTHQAA